MLLLSLLLSLSVVTAWIEGETTVAPRFGAESSKDEEEESAQALWLRVLRNAKNKKKNKKTHAPTSAPTEEHSEEEHHEEHEHEHEEEEGEEHEHHHHHKHAATAPLLIHVGCMLMGWGLLIPCGVTLAHFLRHDHRLTTETWFQWHFWLNSTGLLICFVGWCVALTNFNAFNAAHKHTMAQKHGIVGIVTMCLGLLQPINALIRPSNHPTLVRRTWNVLHHFSGYSALILSIATILMGIPLVAFENEAQIAYVTMLVFVACLLIYLWCARRQLELEDEREVQRYATPSVEEVNVEADLELKPMISAIT